MKEYIGLWGLEPEFLAWAEGENLFCSTVVDRIVTGRPKEDASALCRELGYQDDLPDTGEVFASWIIEGPQSIKAELPFEKAGLPIRVVDDHVPYKQRKVRILNGAHTGFVPAAHLAGFKIVRDCMEDPVVRGFMNRLLYDEVIPTLPLDRKDLEDFAASVADRFNNPYIDHALLSIALNSTSKWKARVMPSLLDSVANTGKLPPCITFSFAAYIAFYRDCPAQDDPWVLEFYQAHQGDSPAQLARAVIRSILCHNLFQLPDIHAKLQRWVQFHFTIFRCDIIAVINQAESFKKAVIFLEISGRHGNLINLTLVYDIANGCINRVCISHALQKQQP